MRNLEWHKVKDLWIGFDGTDIVCAVGREKEFPCEAYSVQFFNGFSTTLEAAKADAEKELQRIRGAMKSPRQTMIETFAPILQNFLDTLMKKTEESESARALEPVKSEEPK